VQDLVKLSDGRWRCSSRSTAGASPGRVAAHRRVHRARRHRQPASRRHERGPSIFSGREVECKLTSSPSSRALYDFSDKPRRASGFGGGCACDAKPPAVGVGRHLKVDDTPYGGGAGMVMRVDCLVECLESLDQDRDGGLRAHRVLLTPRGSGFRRGLLGQLAARPALHADLRKIRGFRRKGFGPSSTKRSHWETSCSRVARWPRWR